MLDLCLEPCFLLFDVLLLFVSIPDYRLRRKIQDQIKLKYINKHPDYEIYPINIISKKKYSKLLNMYIWDYTGIMILRKNSIVIKVKNRDGAKTTRTIKREKVSLKWKGFRFVLAFFGFGVPYWFEIIENENEIYINPDLWWAWTIRSKKEALEVYEKVERCLI